MTIKETTQTVRTRSFEISKAELIDAVAVVTKANIHESADGFTMKTSGNTVIIKWTEHELIEPKKSEPSTAASPGSPKGSNSATVPEKGK